MIKDFHIQPQSISDVINRSFIIGRAMFKQVSPFFYLITVIYFIVAHYLSSVLQGVGQLPALLLTLVNLSFSFFVTAYLMRIMMRESDGKLQPMKWIFLKLVPMLTIASFLYWLFFLAGSILFLIPGIIFFLYFLLFPAIIAFEEKSLIQSFKRSAELVRGSFFRVAALYAIFLGIQSVAVMLISFINVGELFLITGLIAAVVHMIIIPFQATALNLLYFELRAEMEAFDYVVFQHESRRHLT